MLEKSINYDHKHYKVNMIKKQENNIDKEVGGTFPIENYKVYEYSTLNNECTAIKMMLHYFKNTT